MRRYLLFVFLVFFGLVIGAIVCELYLRSIPHISIKFYDNDIFGSALIPSQSGWFVSETNEYKTKVDVNSQGWPDVEHSFEKTNGTRRELIIGDSFVENFQVPFENRFFRQLQNFLGNSDEVVAMGRGNTGTAPQYLIYKNYGVMYKPDIVIHMFFEANDIKNNSIKLQNDPFLPYYTIDESGNLIETDHSKKSLRKMAALKEFVLNFRIVELVLSFRHKIIENQQKHKFGYPIDYHVYDKEYTDDYNNSWEVTKKLILKTKTEVESSGAKYILIIVPGSEQIDQIKQSEIFRTYPEMNPDKIDFLKPEKILAKFCNENKVDCHFMYPYFMSYLSENKDKHLYFFKDGHWTQDGTDLASKFIYQEVLKPLLEMPLFDQKIIPQN